MFIDTHAHLMMSQFDGDMENVLQRARDVDVQKILNVGTDIQTSQTAVRQSQKFSEIYTAAGIHPHEVSKCMDEDWEHLNALLTEPKVLALGEIGLDYYYDYSPRDIQKEWFKKQLQLARELDLPVIVHSREAMEDTLSVIDEAGDSPWKGVFHCFGGTKEDVPEILKRGFHVSFTGVVTFKNFSEKDAVLAVPLERLLLETDAPFMTPVPHRGKRNEPVYIPIIAEWLAGFYNVPIKRIEEQTTKNAVGLFGF